MAAAETVADRLRVATFGALALVSIAVLSGCATAPPSAGSAASTAQPSTIQPFDIAINDLTDGLIAKVDLPPGTRRSIVIDPLIDHGTAYQTTATRTVSAMMEQRIRARWPQFDVQPFNSASLAEQPLIMLGSIAGAPAAGSVEVVVDRPPAYRIWAVVADLKADRVIERKMAWVSAGEVDQTPIAFFRDAPVWTPDPVAAAYITTCSSTAGTTIDPAYRRGLQAEAVIADAMTDYNAGRYQSALTLYEQALTDPAGEQLRVLNGIYLADWALGHRDAAERDFQKVVDYGLSQGRLGVKFLFRPGSTAFWPDPSISGAYPMWIRQIATRSEASQACLALTGHSSTSGAPAVNDRLSRARAEVIRARIVSVRPDMQDRTVATGVGSRDPIVGNGRDDATDALDRRVEVRPADASTCRT